MNLAALHPRATARHRWVNGAIVAAAGLLCLVLPFGASLADWSYDALFWLRSDVPVDEVAIIYMDEASYRELRQSATDLWDRSLHARLIETLTTAGARTVVFDILFADTTHPETDAALVEAARRQGNVCVAGVMSPIWNQGALMGWELQLPFSALRAVTAVGIVEQAGPDQTVRRHYRNAQRPDPASLAAAALLKTTGRTALPTVERWVNYYGPPGFLPHTSYVQALLRPDHLSSLVSNRVVFVGALSPSVPGGRDVIDAFRTPYTVWTGRLASGVEINATTYLNLLRNDWLRRPSPWVELLLVLSAGFLVGTGLIALRPMIAISATIVLCVTAASAAFGIAWEGRVWFPWWIVIAVQLPLALLGALVWRGSVFARERRSFQQVLALASHGNFPPRISDPAAPPDASTLPPQAVTEAPPSPVPDHELLQCIGQGGYGRVWLARDMIGSFHAVKILQRSDFPDPRPFERELEGIRNFTPISRSHPGFIQILHVGRNSRNDSLYCVMELADDASRGQDILPEQYRPRTLAAELARRGRIPLSELLPIAIELADALQHLHQHDLIHRDIKPANILFVRGRPKFADIGLVTPALDRPDHKLSLGTPGRIAPEGLGAPSADIYAFGKVLYEAGLGMDVERFPELPAVMVESGSQRDLFEFNRIVMQACEVESRRRFSSAAELGAALAGLAQRYSTPR